jgi:hypothetical protein
MVSRLFPEFSIGKISQPQGRARLLDIEVRFPTSTRTQTQKGDMIDCLFLLSGGTLAFVEVKTANNDDARGDGNGIPKVGVQLKSYNGHLRPESQRDKVMSVYRRVAETIGKLLDLTVGKPLAVYDRVPLLIMGEKSEPSKNSKEVWQRNLLSQAWDFNAEIIGIDGRNGKETVELTKFFLELEKRPSLVV